MAALPENDRLTGPFIATAGQVNFDADFPLIVMLGDVAGAGVQVQRVRAGELLVLELSAFTISAQSSNGFTVRLKTAALAGDVYWILGRTPQKRVRAHPLGGAVRTPTLEDDAREAAAKSQELARDQERAIVVPIGEAGMVLPPATSRNRKLALFNGVGLLGWTPAPGQVAAGDPMTGELVSLDPHFAIDVSVAQFPSRLAASVTDLPGNLTFLRTAGDQAAGDGGAALWRRVDEEPDLPGKFQTGDGGWWALAENLITPQMLGGRDDGVSDNSAVMAALVALAEAGRSIHFPLGRGAYKTATPLRFTAPVSVTADLGARITLTAAADYVVQIDFSGSGGHFDHTARLENLVLDGDGHASDGLSLKGVIGGRFDNVRATNITRTGLHLHWAQLCVFTNFMCSKNVEAFTTTPVHGLLADEASSSANTFINITIEHTSGQGIMGLGLVNSLFLNGTSEGCDVGIELGEDGGALSAIGNTFIGMDLEVNPGGDIILNASADANEFFGLKAGYASGPVILNYGASRNIFVGGVTGGFVMNDGATRNKITDVSLLGALATVIDNGQRNSATGIFNISTGVATPDTRTGLRKTTSVANGGVYTIDARYADYVEVEVAGATLTMAAPLNPTDGQVIDVAVVNPTGYPCVVSWDAAFRVTGWVDPTSGTRASVRLRFNSNFARWYAIGAPSQVGVPL